MKIVVIGGTGLIGLKTVAILRQGGREVLAASPKSGISTITGEGLKGGLGRRAGGHRPRQCAYYHSAVNPRSIFRCHPMF